MLINTSVIVLKSFSYSENSIIARCFSRDKGKVSFIIKGVYSKKSSKFSQFQPLNYLDVIYKHNPYRDLQVLNKVNFRKAWMKILTDIRSIMLSITILEITEKTLSFEDPHPDLFDTLVNVLNAYNNSKLDPNILFWFYECSLLSYLGFHPDLKKNKFLGMKNIDPCSGIKSEVILKNLLTKDINSLYNEKINSKDRRIISNYLWNLLCYHFDGLINLKSMKVTRKILNDISFTK